MIELCNPRCLAPLWRELLSNRQTSLLLVVLVAICITSPAAGQQVMRVDPETSLVLREIGLVAAMEEGELRVMTMMPGGPGGGQAGAADNSAKSGDVVLMMNGERVSDLDAARSAYDAVAVGDDVKLAVRREDRRFMVSFTKKDPSELEQGNGVVMRRIQIGDGEDAGDIRPILGLSIVARAVDGQVSVVATLPIGKATLADGDIIRQVGGEDLTSVEQLEALVDAAEVGDTLEVTVEREGEQQVLEIEKQEIQGRVMVRGGS